MAIHASCSLRSRSCFDVSVCLGGPWRTHSACRPDTLSRRPPLAGRGMRHPDCKVISVDRMRLTRRQALAMLGGPAAFAPPRDRQPNILYVMTDDHAS